MRKIFFICLLFFNYNINAQINYYISNEGSDANNGFTPSTSWQTLNKINNRTFQPGDSILFKRGESFYGSFKLKGAGNSSQRIIFSGYGIGNKPIITGFNTVSTWVNKGGNVWESATPISTLSSASVVIINGVNIPMGRYPNTGWRTIQSATNTSITDATLPATDWTGADLVTRKLKWIIDRDPITSRVGNTLNFNATGYNPQANWGYFIENDIRTLDSQNEWYYDTTSKKISVYSSTMPTNVQVASQRSLVTMIGYTLSKYINFDGLQFTGANEQAIELAATGSINITNCDFKSNYQDIIGYNYAQNSDSVTVDNCTFNNSQNKAVYFPNEFVNAIVTNNTVNNAGVLVGMSGNSDYTAIGLQIQADNALVQYNVVKNIGYNGITFGGANSVIANNFVDSALLLKDDGGGIYIFQDDAIGKIIRGNIVTNCLGNMAGSPDGYLPNYTNSHGIYIDGFSSNVSIINNFIQNSRLSGIIGNIGHNVTITGNTIVDNFGAGILLNNMDDSATYTPLNLIMKNNIVIQRKKPVVDVYETTYFNQLMLFLSSARSSFLTWGVIDSNYYARPIDDSVMFNIQPDGTTWSPGGYEIKNFAGWKTYSGYDLHSTVSPLSITDSSQMFPVYNATKTSSTFAIPSGTWKDIKGVSYSSNITLPAYSGAVLMQTSVSNRTYYVSNGGKDSNDGLTSATSWKTISKVNSSSFNAGDSILFKKGDTWRETLIVPSGGNVNSYVTYSNYGAGNLPQILGSEQATNWSNVTGNVWMSSTTLNDPALGVNHNGSVSDVNGNWPGSSYYIENNGIINWGHQQKNSQSELTTEYDWWWNAGHIYIYSPTDPTTRYKSFEASQRQYGVNLNAKDYITLDGIEMHFQQSSGTGNPYPPTNRTGLTVRNCKISHIGIKNGAAYGIVSPYSNALIQYNDVSEIGRRGITINAVATPNLVIKNVIVEYNNLHNGYHTTGIDIQSVEPSDLLTNIIVRYNHIWDDSLASVTAPEGFPSDLIFVSEQSGGAGRISNIQIYGNTLQNPSFRGIHLDGIDSAFVYNNTIVGSNKNITQYGSGIWIEGAKTANNRIRNNIFVSTANHTQNMSASAILATSGLTGVTSDYNLFYETDPLGYLLVVGDGSHWYTQSQWTTYKSNEGQDVHSIAPTDPMFVSSSDFHLKSGSPALNAGVYVGLPFTGSAPDIGAYGLGTIPTIIIKDFFIMGKNNSWK